MTEDGVALRDGTTAGVGDLIVTRRNHRQLTSRDGTLFVKNGESWTVQRVHPGHDLNGTAVYVTQSLEATRVREVWQRPLLYLRVLGDTPQR